MAPVFKMENTAANPDVNRDLWKQKAMAFVTRSHRHLWGKNNEDPLAFLFTCGLKNSFIKKGLLGWNKFGQNRPKKSWGLQENKVDDKLFLAPGIVIPFIEKKLLKSVFIHSYTETNVGQTKMLQGSITPTMILGKNKKNIVVIRNLLDGLFLFQELNETLCVIIHPDQNIPFDEHLKSKISIASKCFIFSSEKREKQLNHKEFSNFSDNSFHTYSSKEKLIENVLAV